MIALSGGADTGDDDLDLAHLLVHHPQRVDQRGEHDDGGAVLVVVEDRDVELVAQPALDLEAARGGDVLQVDPAVDRGERLDDADDLLGVLGVQADRPGVDAGELLEQGGLALHHGQGGGRADVTQAEHGGPVGDHGHGVALDGEPPGVLGVCGDGQADPGDTWGVGAGEVVAVLQRDLGLHGQLAAEVQQEGAVTDLADRHSRSGVDHLGDLLRVLLVDGVAGDVDDDRVVTGLDDVERCHRGTGVGDRRCQVRGRAGTGADGDAEGDRVTGTGAAGHSGTPQVIPFGGF